MYGLSYTIVKQGGLAMNMKTVSCAFNILRRIIYMKNNILKKVMAVTQH